MYFKKNKFIELVDVNEPELETKEKLAICIGFTPDQRDYFRKYFPNYCLAFTFGKASSIKILSILRSLDRTYEVFIWGYKEPRLIAKYLEAINIKIKRVEEGFIYSIGSGGVKPLSLVIDDEGLYFNSKSESKLEKIIFNNATHYTNQQLQHARQLIDLINKYNISKYNSISYSETNIDLFVDERKKNILVIGQDKEDISIKLGSNGKVTNLDLLKKARKENKNANILYKQPDTLTTNRKNKTSIKEYEEIGIVVSQDINIQDLIELSDHVYTITSLFGFEALLRGKKVTCFGSPFYAHWGLTDDRCVLGKRRKKTSLTLEQLFYASYIEYPLYMGPVVSHLSTPDNIINYLIVMMRSNAFYSRKVNYYNQLQNVELEKILKNHDNDLSIKVLDYIYNNKDLNHLIESILKYNNGYDILFDMFFDVSLLYISTFKYDGLKRFFSLCMEIYNENLPDININNKISFLKDFVTLINRLNGRKLDVLPDSDISFDLKNEKEKQLFFVYFNLYSMTCNYEDLYGLLEDTNGLDAVILLRLCDASHRHPMKSHTNGLARSLLVSTMASKALVLMENKYKRHINSLINNTLYYSALNNLSDLPVAIKVLNKAIKAQYSAKRLRKPLRLKVLIPVLNKMITKQELKLAEILLFIVNDFLSKKQKRLIKMKLTFFGKQDVFQEEYFDVPAIYQEYKLYQSTFAEFNGKFRLAQELLEEYIQTDKTMSKAKALAIQTRIERIQFLNDTSEIVNKFPQPIIPKGIVFLASLGSLDGLSRSAPVILELKKQGYVVIDLNKGMITNQLTRFDNVNKFSGCIPKGYTDRKIQLQWKIDWSRKIVECQGINFYQGIYEILSAIFRKFTIDIYDPVIGHYFEKTLKECDFILRVLNNIKKDVVDKGLPVVFFGCNSQMAPYSVFRDYSYAQNHPKIRFSIVNIAYESYFSNLGSLYASSISVVDMTLYKTCRQPFLGVEEKFEKWYQDNTHLPDIGIKIDKVLKMDRSNKHQEKKSKYHNIIMTARNEGKKIICCLGKVLADLGVPYDAGPAHEDIKDWLNHTIELASDENILVLIKPHPHELRPEIAMNLQETLRDILPQDLPENILFLEHDAYNIHELIDYIDLAILWNGTSSLELTIQGVPVVMCSYFGKHDYYVDHIYPESRSDYVDIVLAKSNPIPKQKDIKRAAAQLYFMGTKEVALPYEYSKNPVTNDRTGVPSWIEDEVDIYLKNGDPYIKLAAERVVEGLEK